MMDIPSHYHLQFVILLGESIDFDLILAKYLHFTTFGDGSGHFQNLSSMTVLNPRLTLEDPRKTVEDLTARAVLA